MARISRMLVVLLAVSVVTWSAVPAAAQETNHRGVQFLLAANAGDLDAAMQLLVDEPELVDADGNVSSGREPVRASLEALPRPILVVETRPFPSGSRMFQVRITAGGAPLLVTFHGAGGSIARLVFEAEAGP